MGTALERRGSRGRARAAPSTRKPWQNATDESFNGKFRDEFLSLQWFRNRMDAKVGIEQWRQHYNEVRPHSSLGYLTPAEFKAQLGTRSDDGGRSGREGVRLSSVSWSESRQAGQHGRLSGPLSVDSRRFIPRRLAP